MSTFPSHENSNSDFLQLEPMVHSRPEQSGVGAASPAGDATALEHRQAVDSPKATLGERASHPTPTDDNWDVDRELKSLFELMGTPSQPLERSAPKAKAADLTIPAELKTESQRLLESIAETQQQLATIQQSSQEKLSAIENGFVQAEQLQHRTEQLAKYSKLQVRQLQEMLESFEQVRQEIVAALDKFGSYDRIEPLVQKIQGAEQSLTQAHDRLHIQHTELYQSLQGIQQQVEHKSHTFEQSFQQKQADLKKLLLAIREDRERVIALEESVENRVVESDRLHQAMQALQVGLDEKSLVVKNNLTDMNSNFASLSESVQHEKQQFYQLTAEMINKTDAMRSQFAEQAKQVSKYWEAIQSLQFKVDDLDDRVDSQTQGQAQLLNQRYEEMASSWGDLKKKQQGLDRYHRTQQSWLKFLTAGLGVSMLMVVVLLFKTFVR
jgi:chromosome segregation ATPase